MIINNIDKNLKKNKVGDILNAFPCTKYFFDKYKIDYCCGGQITLEQALIEKSINNEQIFNELIDNIKNMKVESSTNEIIKSTDLTSKSSEEIIKFIVEYFHEGLRDCLPKINEKLLKAMRAHIKNHKNLFWKVHELLGNLIVLCESHLILEEEKIFKPMIEFDRGMIKQGDDRFIEMRELIVEATKEHDIIGPTILELESVTNNYNPPQDACNTVKSVYEELKNLQENLIAHTQVENNILFPRYIK